MTESAGTTFSAFSPWSTVEMASLAAFDRPEGPGLLSFFLPLFTFIPPNWRALSVASAVLKGSNGTLSRIRYVYMNVTCDISRKS
jgi:hypothetical protein